MSGDRLDLDVLIVGGGMVGATLALALSRQTDFRIGLMESRPPADLPQQGFDLRVSAITRASERIFRHLDVWESMLSMRVSPYSRMRVWQEGGSIGFDAQSLGEPNLGHIVENRVIVHALWQALIGQGVVELLAGKSPIQYLPLTTGIEIETDRGDSFRTALLVAADGADSSVRSAMGIGVKGRSYGQKGLVSTVRPEMHHEHTAYQRFLPGGPVALLPLTDGHCSVVWSLPEESADALLAMDEAEFLLRLEAAVEGRLGAFAAAGPRAAFPLRLQHADHYVEANLALVGDAAHSIHPLAGQGVNLGLLDAVALAQVLAEHPGDAGRFGTLRRYERWRKGENLLMMSAMDGFQRLFGNDVSVLRNLRGSELAIVDRVTPLKSVLMRRAMGLEGDLPHLARE